MRLVAGCKDTTLTLSEVLFDAGDPLRHVYFPRTGFISLLTPVDGTTRLEVGLVGNEGMVGTPLVLGIATSHLQALVQGAGQSLRMAQLAQAAGCTRFHLVEARLARWLLMTQDRAHSSHFHITHEFLALKLGVRRAGVTKAATSLQKRRLIAYSRGDISVLDRPGLKAASCACYRTDRETYKKFLG